VVGCGCGQNLAANERIVLFMPIRDRYPAGVPCWVDTSQADPAAGAEFYGSLFGWTLEDKMPPQAPGHFFEASLNGGGRVAAVSSKDQPGPTTWMTYIAVDDADEVAQRVRANGGTVAVEPLDINDAGRMAVCADPEGARFALWQAGRNIGAELVNVPGSWNFSALNTGDLEAAKRFYGAVFSWEFAVLDYGTTMVMVPGYADYLESIDPGVKQRHVEGGAPPGFSDCVAWFDTLKGEGPANWSVTFTVEDADASAARTTELGGTVLAEPFDVPWQRITVIRDPQGATLTLSQFKPPA
jgi:predicted enzyme related to lactoylglutathione lyase